MAKERGIVYEISGDKLMAGRGPIWLYRTFPELTPYDNYEILVLTPSYLRSKLLDIV